LDPKQYIGQWTGIDPKSVEGKKDQVVTAISEIPQTHAIPIDDNEWVFTWTLGKSKVDRSPPFCKDGMPVRHLVQGAWVASESEGGTALCQ
jgi:hypothetical protein